MESIIFLLVFGGILLLIWSLYNKGQNKVKDLKEIYETSLKGTDKKAALEAGRAYYKALRNTEEGMKKLMGQNNSNILMGQNKGNIINTDEAAIANDINIMMKN